MPLKAHGARDMCQCCLSYICVFIPVPTVTAKINDVKITCVKECKYLGVIIDDKLKMDSSY